MSSSPITLRLPDDLHDRLEQSRIAAGETSPAAAIRRLLRQALDQNLIDDRLARLIQERVAIPADLAKQYARATDAAIQAVNASQAEIRAGRGDIQRLLSTCHWLRENFSPTLTRQALLLCVGLLLGMVGGTIGGLFFSLLFLR